MEAPNNIIELMDSFKQGPSKIEKVIADLSDNDLNYVPINGGWSIRQIIHHIADGDDLWKTCIKMTLGNQQPEFNLKWYQAMPQMEWAKHWNYENRSIAESLNLFKANRDHILQLLEYTPNWWIKKFQYEEPDGKINHITIGFVIKMQTNHAIHHLNRILEIQKEISANN